MRLTVRRLATPGLALLCLVTASQANAAAPGPVSSLTLSPTSVAGGVSSTGTVTLTNVAPAGGATVVLTSSKPATASVPSSVVVAAGAKTATFTVTTTAVTASTSATISASYSGGTKTATLTVTPPALSSVSVSPTTVGSGQSATGTVTLSGAAPAAGIAVTLTSSKTSVATVPASVTVPSGSATATFDIATYTVTADTSVTITAAIGRTKKTATLTVTPVAAQLSSITLYSASVLGGASMGSNTVSLTQLAPNGGASVSLTSSAPSIVSVPASVTVPAGQASAAFTLSSTAVAADTNVTITAVYGGVTRTANLLVVKSLAITLSNGTGPFYTRASTINLAGNVVPGSAGTETAVTATLGAYTQTQQATNPSGSFGMNDIPLASGRNDITFTARHVSGATAAPVVATYILDTTPPTAIPVLSTQVPNPTNQPTWTLSGTVTGYQGPVENAFVYINGGATKLPIAADGTWTGSYTFPEGSNTIPFAVADKAGNLGPAANYSFNINTQGIKPLFASLDGQIASGEGTWPASLDNTYRQVVRFYGQTGTTLVDALPGSHLDVFLDEAGSGSGQATSCVPEDLTCLVQRKTTPDLSATFTREDGTDTSATLPPLSVGPHNIRMVLTDPFGTIKERGGVVFVGPPSGYTLGGETVWTQPLASIAVPSPITTLTPKLAGRTAGGLSPIDCTDAASAKVPTLEYWDPKSGGSWKPLASKTAVNVNGTYEIAPDYTKVSQGKLPITTNASGQSVLRLRLTEGFRPGLMSVNVTYNGRKICNGTSTLTASMSSNAMLYGGDTNPATGAPNAGTFAFDLPYRAPQSGDSVNPQVDVSATPSSSIVTDDEAPLSTRLKFRVTDLNGDLNYRTVTATLQGCTGAGCTQTARLDGDQQLASATPGGWFSVPVNVPVGSNVYQISATDDAGHIGTGTITVTRTLSSVLAKITSPTTTGSFGFRNPLTVLWDASQSLNRSVPLVPLRFQWTRPKQINGSVTTWEQITTSSSYSEYLTWATQGFAKRRVIVSLSTGPVPNPAVEDPCSGAPQGTCSVALTTYGTACQPQGQPVNPRITSPATSQVGMSVPLTLAATLGWDTAPTYVYHWELAENATGRVIAIPQTAGPGGDGYAFENRVLTVTLANLGVTNPGAYTLRLSAGAVMEGATCAQAVGTTTMTLNVVPKLYAVTGVAPGAVVLGTTDITLYGGFDASAQVYLAGPVYTLTDTNNALCDVGAGACPTQALGGTLLGQSSALRFSLPPAIATGYYVVYASDGTIVSTRSVFLEVQPSSTTVAKNPQFDGLTTPIHSGQVVEGQFIAGRDPSGQFSDKDQYYFFATAGSTISASLMRVDESLPWEHPDALDPELDIVDPDGILSEPFQLLDTKPGVDLNAVGTNLVLPKTGQYLVIAATSKGAGAYRLAFNLAPAPSAPGQRVLPAANNNRTVQRNTMFKPAVFAFDSQGYPISGAVTQWTPEPTPGETGTITFTNGSTSTTSTLGFSGINALMTTIGKITYLASLQDNALNAGFPAARPEEEAPAVVMVSADDPIGRVELRTRGFDVNSGVFTITVGNLRQLTNGKTPGAPIQGREVNRTQSRTPGQAGPAPISSIAAAPADGGANRAAVQKLRPVPLSGGSCSNLANLTSAAVDAPTISGPFTLKITDQTPKMDGTGGDEVIGVDGIHDHRVEKKIKLKIEVKDSSGNEPSYPILIKMRVAGSNAGKLALGEDDPTCSSLDFLWHERNAEGAIVANNDIVSYKLGKKSGIAGVKPDPSTPGAVMPVWGATEYVDVFLGAIDSENGLVDQLSVMHSVKPQAGRPVNMKQNPRISGNMEFTYQTWAGYWNPDRNETVENNFGLSNLIYLVDEFDNYTYGFTTTSATNPAANVRATFSAQTPPASEGMDAYGYSLLLDWDNHNGASFPVGDKVVSLTAGGRDPETGEQITITQSFTAHFTETLIYSITRWIKYDYDKYSTVPGHYEDPLDDDWDWSTTPKTFIGEVSPGMPLNLLNGQPARKSILFLRAQYLSREYRDEEIDEVPPDSTPLALNVNDSFNISLVNWKGEVATDAEIEVAYCPIYSHSLLPNDAPCAKSPTTSANGVLTNIQPAGHGYLGLIVRKAPVEPGTYYFKIVPAGTLQEPWKIHGNWPLAETVFFGVRVATGEFLDESLQRIRPIPVSGTGVGAFVRLHSASEQGSFLGKASTRRQDDTPLSTDVGITFTRLGRSNIFLAPITLVPEDSSARPATRAGASGPNMTVAVGRTTLLAVAAGTQITGQSNKPGSLRFRFMVRKDSCTTITDDSCLTSADPNDPNGFAGQTQETYVDETQNYGERVRVLVDVVDANGARVPGISEPLAISEVPNTAYREDLVGKGTGVIPDPEVKRRLFYDGILTSSKIEKGLIDGQSIALTDSRAVLTLRSVATAHYDDASGQVIKPTRDQPLLATFSVAATPSFPDATKSIRQWVDEASYVRSRGSQKGAWTDEPAGNQCYDWLEMKAWDVLATVQAPSQEATDAFAKVAHMRSDWSVPPFENPNDLEAHVDPGEPDVVKWYPRKPLLRARGWQVPPGSGGTGVSSGQHYYGLQFSVSLDSYFDVAAVHEPRHAWIYTLGATDADRDTLYQNPPPSSPELRDGAFGVNSEFSFSGDSDGVNGDDRVTHPYWLHAAHERNAVRFAGTVVGYQAACDVVEPFVVQPASPLTATVFASFEQPGGSLKDRKPFIGAVVHVEYSPSSATCNTPSGWADLGLIQTDAAGRFSFDPGLLTGAFRFVVRQPTPCSRVPVCSVVTW